MGICAGVLGVGLCGWGVLFFNRKLALLGLIYVGVALVLLGVRGFMVWLHEQRKGFSTTRRVLVSPDSEKATVAETGTGNQP